MLPLARKSGACCALLMGSFWPKKGLDLTIATNNGLASSLRHVDNRPEIACATLITQPKIGANPSAKSIVTPSSFSVCVAVLFTMLWTSAEVPSNEEDCKEDGVISRLMALLYH